jgi:hypothetical protein
MNKTFVIIVSVQQGPLVVTEVPTGTVDATTGVVTISDATGSHGGGTPMLSSMLMSGKWAIQSIQQLGQQSTNGALVNVFLLVANF